MKKLSIIILCLALCLGALTGCGDIVIDPAPSEADASAAPATLPPDVIDGEKDSSPKGAEITLEGSGARIHGSGVSASGGVVTISSPGSYSVKGRLDDGCIIVNTGEVKGDVTLTLRGAEITCLSGPAIHVIEAKNFDLVLENGTENRLVSGSADAIPDVKLDGAALFCEDDLDILGTGSLEVFGYLNNGITCKDDLDIKDGTITVTAVNNGVQGSESVEIFAGSLSVRAGNDGVKSTSAKKEGKGFVSITGGMLEIQAGGDGIAAETELTVSGGEIRVTTTGESEGSSKAVKAKTMLTVSGGTLVLDSAEHTVHSAGDMLLSGGTLSIVSRAGKGVSAHGALELSGSTLDIESADDALEAEESITVSGGEIRLLAGADGLKAGSKSGSGIGTLTIEGGSVTVSAHGDPFDAKGGAVISDGVFIGVGSPKTPQGFSEESTQRSLLFAFGGAKDTAAEVKTASGESVGTIESRCGYTCAIFSCPGLTAGSYTLSLGTLSASAEA